ncbi:MAG: hypothetical protein U1D25_19565 [Hydrogenophaga sp.]|uniref:SDH family Clp fold serine proteinase n=1 Tax=Hydrogenophaga sp. TaxID=1904254 RepID=UPI0027586FE5|nr:hypothetical protein [Hydrogenophaga sp.]MDP2418892.1 hypothetical protein [Hydrogenophaga sp.]MDZ4190288.1 hypothetical protein [Hydrogenophaga sp.]
MDAVDIITYSGEINRQGYAMLCDVLQKKVTEKALLVLATPGGDPHAGFRIARALQHTYENFDAVIPGACKSAGTLVVVGASKLYMDDMSELGPLDIQVKKSDEVIGRNSGLDVLQAVSYLQTNAMSAFRSYLLELTSQAGLSTRVASDIASRLTTGLYEPVFAQVDPMRLAEMQRAMEIAFAYGRLLNERSGNLRHEGLEKLVTGYPAHAFVIDRKEAKSIFVAVEKPEGFLLQLCQGLYSNMQKNQFSPSPEVAFYALKGDQDADPANQSAPANQPSSAGRAQGNGQVDCGSADPAENGSASCGDISAFVNA